MRPAQRLSLTAQGYPRRQSRAGNLKLRQGSFPCFLEPHRRSEAARLAVAAEGYMHGGRTRKVRELSATLGITSLSPSEVSRICARLDEQLTAFRCRAWHSHGNRLSHYRGSGPPNRGRGHADVAAKAPGGTDEARGPAQGDPRARRTKFSQPVAPAESTSGMAESSQAAGTPLTGSRTSTALPRSKQGV